MKISIEQKYQEYLKKVGFSEDKMSVVQCTEMRRTFFGAFGIALLTLRDEVGAIDNEDNAVYVMQNMLDQVNEFFKNGGIGI